MANGVSALGYLTTLVHLGIPSPKNVFIDLYLREEIKAAPEAVTLHPSLPSLTDSPYLMEINAPAGLCSAAAICNLLHQGKEGRGDG